MVHVLAGSLGVSAIVLASAELFTALKLLGAAYLVWIGLRTVRAARRGCAGSLAGRGRGAADRAAAGFPRRGAGGGARTPTTAAFFLAFVPQFVDPAAGSVAPQFALLGLVSVALNTLCRCGGGLRGGWRPCRRGSASRVRPAASVRRPGWLHDRAGPRCDSGPTPRRRQLGPTTRFAAGAVSELCRANSAWTGKGGRRGGPVVSKAHRCDVVVNGLKWTDIAIMPVQVPTKLRM